MREQKRIQTNLIDPDPDQPRKLFNDADEMGLGTNMKKYGQAIPLLVYPVEVLQGDKKAIRFMIADGERRWRAAAKVQLEELDCLVVSEKPTPKALHTWRLSVDVHRKSLTAMERANEIVRVQKEQNWSIGETAANLQMPQSVVSKLAAFNQKLCPEVQAMLHRGEIDTERAYIICGEPDTTKQIELAKVPNLSRDELRRRIRKPSAMARVDDVRLSSVQFTMPGGYVVGLKGKELGLELAVQILAETLRLLKKGLNQGLDVFTQARVMRETCEKARKSC